ncbi:hypothetical protein HNY73_013290 [Argiope bruennichi]|uniref:Uncharacterized protein n=1 Tax=Argiope bruennichi TaxID=94029 RepID=A0A8T0F281_ARGBR|nr:hypothetical protein HNY73_013290 [Argiope bruennichi]
MKSCILPIPQGSEINQPLITITAINEKGPHEAAREIPGLGKVATRSMQNPGKCLHRRATNKVVIDVEIAGPGADIFGMESTVEVQDFIDAISLQVDLQENAYKGISQ